MTEHNPAPTQKDGLLPCPFCGSPDVFVERADFSACFVMCNDCSARGPCSDPENDEDLEIEERDDLPSGHPAGSRAWNTRATPHAEAAPVHGEAEAAADGCPKCGKVLMMTNTASGRECSSCDYLYEYVDPDLASKPPVQTEEKWERAKVALAAFNKGYKGQQDLSGDVVLYEISSADARSIEKVLYRATKFPYPKPVQNTPATSYAADSSGTNASMGLHAAPDDDQDGGVLLQTDLIAARDEVTKLADVFFDWSADCGDQLSYDEWVIHVSQNILAIINRMIAGKAEGV